MHESTPKFNDARKASFGRPAFARDINAALESAFDEWLARPPDESPAPGRPPTVTILLGKGKPHEALAGVMADRAQVELIPNWDVGATGTSLYADAKDDKLYRDDQTTEGEEEDDASGTILSIDAAELCDVTPAHYVAHNAYVPSSGSTESDPDDARDVYITSEPVRSFLISPSPTLIRANVWRYKGKQARMKRPPRSTDTSHTDVWEAHPDAEEVDLYNEAELDNRSGFAGGRALDSDYTGVLAVSGIVRAVRRSYAASGDDPAGVAWCFRVENIPVLSCS